MTRRGVTLLETMIALVILAMTVTAMLQVLSRSARTTQDLSVWSAAVAHAEDGMERAKIDAAGELTGVVETLPDGFRRRITRRPVDERLASVSVVVEFPDGRVFTLDRLMDTSP